MSQCAGRGRFVHAGAAYGYLHGSLHALLEEMVAPFDAAPRIDCAPLDRERGQERLGFWSEGALYSIRLRKALHVCHGLLRPGGYLAFTDAIWRKENPPPVVKASFDLDNPTMGWLDDDVAAIQDCGFDLVGHFTLPDEAWWDDFYTPMEARIAELRGKYANDVEASAILDRLAEEPEMHRRYSDFYAYEFFVARRPLQSRGPEMNEALERGAPAEADKPRR